MRGKRFLRLGLAGSVLAFLFCGGTGTCIVARSWESLSGSTMTVGRDTTYLEGPLDSQGFVDYAAALNQQASAGVTPDDNAAVLLAQALGPPECDADYCREYYRLLGIEPLPAEGEYYVSGDSFVEDLEAEAAAGSEEAEISSWAETPGARERFWRDHEEASTRPWTAREFPDLARWIEMNDSSVDLVIEASRRPKCYLPIILLTSEEGLLSAGGWLTQASRDVFRLLSIRATLRVGQGRIEAAWEDLLADHRLARHVSQNPKTIDGLVGLAMEGIVTRSQTVLIHYGVPTSGQIRQMQQDLNDLPSQDSMVKRLVVGERLRSLDSIVCVSRYWMVIGQEDAGVLRESEIGQKVLGSAGRAAIDWDEILRIANQYYDDLEEALELPTGQERYEAVAALEASLEDEREQSRGPGRFLRSFVSFRSPKKTMSRHLGNMHLLLLTSSAHWLLRADDRCIAHRRMLRIALAAAAYRTEYGVYPESLDAVSDYLPAIPVDPHSEKSFLYRLEGDGFVLYSVGANGLDEEGRNETGAAETQADDIALHVPPQDPDGSQSCYCD